MKIIEGGVTAPEGFLAAGVKCEVKKGRDKKDLAIIYSEERAVAAGVFTRNLVKAAPVILTEKLVAQGSLQALVINSGNANACTGEQGMEDARQMAHLTAQALGIDSQSVGVASTGVIGAPLPMDRIEKGIKDAAGLLSRDGHTDAALAIMTTDTRKKECAVQVQVGGKTVTIGGMAKGSGMIHPNMATMLGFVTTDVAIEPTLLKNLVKKGTDRTFNMITVDGDTSTNDTLVVLANGLAGNATLQDETSEDMAQFEAGLYHVLEYLAKEIARDGEGATKFIEINVKGAKSYHEGRQVAKSVAGSNLVKTAIFGQDANWGRILAAVGYSGATIDPNKVDIYLGHVKVAENGAGLAFDEDEALAVLRETDVTITIDLKSGSSSATSWTCDLTFDYIKINADYRT
jgi:glutamate N-acetyltransferase/amino-acid N-acetyltransferase